MRFDLGLRLSCPFKVRLESEASESLSFCQQEAEEKRPWQERDRLHDKLNLSMVCWELSKSNMLITEEAELVAYT